MIEFKNVKIFSNEQIHNAVEQVAELANHYQNAKIRVMPDYHTGAGCVIGLTMQTSDVVNPEIVGVDIGCGVTVFKFNQDVSLCEIDTFIKEHINENANQFNVNLSNKLITSLKCFDKLKNIDYLNASIGTLGSGNHFIEIDTDETNKYLVIHSGSRNLGLQVANYYTMLYKNGEDFFKDYIYDIDIVQKWAQLNRTSILTKITKHFNLQPLEIFESIHNYIDIKNNIIRKGAISAQKGQKVIIPLNMRDGSIIGAGLGNEDWNFSAPHGAGRVMSRSEAKKNISLDDFQNAMNGIFTTSVSQKTLDEAPFAYKNANEIIELVKDTVEIETLIRPIYNFKNS